MRQPVMIDWGISSLFGWGVYGLNLALAWSSDPDIAPVGMHAVDRSRLVIDPLRMLTLADFFAATERNVARRQHADGAVNYDHAVLTCLGNNLQLASEQYTGVSGKPKFGIVFFEDTLVTDAAIADSSSMPCIVTGSTWNERVLRDRGIDNVVTVFQGVDPSLFHPAPRLKLLERRFKVFSGGKLEFRKGQDIVIAAFARFARSHPDALLVTAWHSPWAALGRTLDASKRAAPLAYDAQGRLDLKTWADRNGIPARQFLDVGRVPNGLLPPILREMDAALFTNRAEGGTNLVAMECMACGVPTILSANTGHLDLIEDMSCWPLRRQRDVSNITADVGQTAGWGESDEDEVVEALETIYRDRAQASLIGAAGAAKLANMTWQKTAAAFKDIVLSA